MAFQSVPECVEAVIRGTMNGNTCVNVLTFSKVGGGYDQSDVENLAAAVDAWFGENMLGAMSSAATYLDTTVRGLELPNDVYAINNDSTGNGADSGTPLPASVSACIKFGTGLTGRSARGRSYMWGLGAGALATNENNLSTVFTAAIVGFYEELPAVAISAGFSHVVVSRYALNAVRPIGIFFPIIDYSVVTQHVASARRRVRSS